MCVGTCLLGELMFWLHVRIVVSWVIGDVCIILQSVLLSIFHVDSAHLCG